MSRILRTLGLFCLLFLVVGCGGQPAADAPAADAPSTEPTTTPAADPPAGASANAGDDPCAALTIAEVAAVFGADASNVTQAVGDAAEYSKGLSNDCNTVVLQDNLETTVTLLIQAKGENAAADQWTQRIQRVLAEGEKIGSQTYSYEPFTGGGIEGALSDLHGGTYVRIRSLQWQADEKYFYRLTIASTLDDGDPADLTEPPAELFAQLIEAATN